MHVRALENNVKYYTGNDYKTEKTNHQTSSK